MTVTEDLMSISKPRAFALARNWASGITLYGLILVTLAALALGCTSPARAAQNHTGAWGLISTMGTQNPIYDAIWLVTGDPTDPIVHKNLIYVNMDMQYNYPSYGQWESATWRPSSKYPTTQRFPASLLGSDPYPVEGRYIQLRNLTLERADLDAQNVEFRFVPIPAGPGTTTSLTLNNGSLTALNPPLFNDAANFTLTASGDSTLSNWGKGPVSSQTTLNVTPGSKLTFFRLGKFAGGTFATDSWYFSHTGNVATIDGGTLRLNQSYVTFGKLTGVSNPAEMSRMTFQNNAVLDIVGEGGRLDSGNFFFLNSRLNLGSANRFKAADTVTLNGATLTTDEDSKLVTEVLDIYGNNSITLGKQTRSVDYLVTTGSIAVRPDALLTLNGRERGSLAVTFQLLYDPTGSGQQQGQIVIDDNATLVNSGALFDIRPNSPITINRTSDAVSGALVATNGGNLYLRASAADPGHVTNHGQIVVEPNSALVALGPVIIQGGDEGLVSIGDGGTLSIGNAGTALAATQSLTTNNLVELDNFSTLQLTLDPTALKNGQLRAGSKLGIDRFAELHLGLVNDQVLPDGTKFTLVDYGAFAFSQHFFKGYPNGSSFVLGLNKYLINYADTPNPGAPYTGAITLTVIPAKPLSLAYPTPITAFVGSLQAINPALANLTGTPTYTLASGALPSGMILNPNTGVISGIPTGPAGAYSATIQLSQTGAQAQTTTAALTINVVGGSASLQLIYPDLLNVPAGSGPYSLVPSTTGFTGPITFSLVDGSLPPGLSLDPVTGIISGTPTTATSRVLTPTISASAQGGAEFIQNVLEIEILPTLSYAPATVTVGIPVSLTPTVSPVLKPGTYSVVGGKLPAGLTLNPTTGVISGIPTNPLSTTVTIEFATGTGHVQKVTAAVPITVNANPISITYPPSTATIGKPFNLMPKISGTTGTPTYSVSGGQLPTGLYLNSATGAISGTPTGPTGVFTAQITVTNQNTSNTVSVAITVQAEPNSIPTLPEYGLMIMAGLMILAASWHLRAGSGL